MNHTPRHSLAQTVADRPPGRALPRSDRWPLFLVILVLLAGLAIALARPPSLLIAFAQTIPTLTPRLPTHTPTAAPNPTATLPSNPTSTSPAPTATVPGQPTARTTATPPASETPNVTPPPPTPSTAPSTSKPRPATSQPGLTPSPAGTSAASPTASPSAPHLTLRLEVSRPDVLPGESVQFALWITNTGTGPATGILVRDQLDPALEPLSVSATDGAADVVSQIITYTLGLLEPKQTVLVLIEARISTEAQRGQIILNESRAYYAAFDTVSNVTALALPPLQLPPTGAREVPDR